MASIKTLASRRSQIVLPVVAFSLVAILLGLISAWGAFYLVFIVAGGGVVLLSLRDPVYAIGLYFFHSAIQNLVQLPFAIAPIVGPILILCAFLGIITQVIRSRKKISYSFHWLDLMIVLLSLLIVISTQYSLSPYNELDGIIRELLGVLGIYFAMRLGLNSPDQLQKLAWFSVIGFVLLAANALGGRQAQFDSLLASLPYIGSNSYFNSYMIDASRLRSALTLNDPNYFAWTLLMPIAMAGVISFQSPKWPIRILSGSCFLVMFTALVVSQSRGMWIALVIMMVIFVFRMSARFRWPGLLGVLLVGWVVYSFGWDLIGIRLQDLTGSRDTMSQRFVFWRIAIDVFQKHPLTGVGYGNFPLYNPSGNVVHNTFLSFFAETGLMGGLSLIAIYWLVWASYRRAQKKLLMLGEDKLLLFSIGLEVGIVGQVVGFMSLTFNLSPHLILGIALAGVLANLPLMAEKRLESASPFLTHIGKFGNNRR